VLHIYELDDMLEHFKAIEQILEIKLVQVGMTTDVAQPLER
jgi:hypothetical protein